MAVRVKGKAYVGTREFRFFHKMIGNQWLFLRNMKILRFLAAFFLPLSLTAQPDTWDVYLAQYEKGPGSVMLNMSLKDKAPVKLFPFAVVTGVSFPNCDTSGLPDKNEFPRLYRISDSVLSVLNRYGENIPAGTFTYQCQRLDYFYVADTGQLRKKLLELYRQKFPGYIPFVNIKQDSSWSAYREILYPNEEVFEYMQNQKVLNQLQKAGDKLDQERTVDHFLYFKNKNDRSCFTLYATQYGFKLEALEMTADPISPFKLHISRTDKLDLASISKITIELRKEAKKCNGSYDSWETVLVR